MKKAAKPRKIKRKSTPKRKKSQLAKNWKAMKNAFNPGEPEKKLKKYGGIYKSLKGL